MSHQLPQEIVKCIPKSHRDLFKRVHFGECDPYTGQKRLGLWLAVAHPGGVLQIRHKHELRKQSGKISVLHEYGHYAHFFKLKKTQQKRVAKAYEKAGRQATKEAKKRTDRVYYPYRTWKEYYTAQRAGRNVKEAFAESYAWYFGGLRQHLKQKKPEMFQVFKKIFPQKKVRKPRKKRRK